MPFDAAGAKIGQTTGTLLASAGIIPVNEALLDQHIQQQLEANPPSKLYAKRNAIRKALAVYGFLTVITTIGSVIWDVGGDKTGLSIWLFLGSVLSAVAFLIIDQMKLKGPSIWIENVIYPESFDYFNVPQPVKDLAHKLVQETQCGLIFTIGQLKQNSVVIDPYLLVASSDDPHHKACLGIWLGKTVLHIATRNAS